MVLRRARAQVLAQLWLQACHRHLLQDPVRVLSERPQFQFLNNTQRRCVVSYTFLAFYYYLFLKIICDADILPGTRYPMQYDTMRIIIPRGFILYA